MHFTALDNVSAPKGAIGDPQLAWLKSDLAKQKPDSGIVVLTHRPLFPLYPQWDWAPKDGEQAIAIRPKKFEYTRYEITLKVGEPVVLEFTTEDAHMGFDAPELGLSTDIVPGKTGRFEFACDVLCGFGHEEMTGVIKVLA